MNKVIDLFATELFQNLNRPEFNEINVCNQYRIAFKKILPKYFIAIPEHPSHQKNSHGSLSHGIQDIIGFSKEEALRLGHDYIGTEHLLLGMIRNGTGRAIEILNCFGANRIRLKKAIEECALAPNNTPVYGNIQLTKSAETVLKMTYIYSKLCRSDIVDTEHLLLSLLRDEEVTAAKILKHFNISYEIVFELLQSQSNQPTQYSQS